MKNKNYTSENCFRRSSGFTLIEMLVVIAIIGLLSGILVPVVSKARIKASGLKCMGNLRTLQLSNQMYANDHRAWFVSPTSWDNEGVQGVNWHVNADFLQYFISDEEALENSEKYWSTKFPLLCPATRRLGSDMPDLVAANYGLNIGFHSALGIADWGTQGAKWRYSADYFPSAARTVAFADCTDWLLKQEYFAYTEDTEGRTTDGRLAYRHLGQAFAVHFDGHVGVYTKEDLQDAQMRSHFNLEE
ncbi:type II secretion system protein [Kiritimatiellota bacterium B12222]|nr:type II secretion system protein [Kiritimatiellota bacterium B12222]